MLPNQEETYFQVLKFGGCYCYTVWKDPNIILMQAQLLFSQKIAVCNYLGPEVALNGSSDVTTQFWSLRDFRCIDKACWLSGEPVYRLLHCLIVGKVSALEITTRDWREAPWSWFGVPSSFLSLSQLFS